MNKTVELTDTEAPKQFGMLVNAKSFGIIVNGIYSHKIRAVIREYTTNCIDSHLQAGHSKPYDCHIPTQNNPVFYVRDYGVGLDEDDIVNVFTVAFASTKENSALTTGNLGIGAMSAFCYNSKSFTVTSWKNGIKYIYHMYLDATDAPCYTKMLEEKSDEPTGVKVEFPVKSSDIWNFHDEAENVFTWQEVKPNLLGLKIDIAEPVKSYTGFGWYLCNDVNNCSVLMGGVLYDVEVGETTLSKFNDYIRSKIVIEAPIGSVDFQPSRERLQYTKKTISFLRKVFLDISREVLESFDKDVKNAPSLWDAKTSLQKMISVIPSNIIKLIDLNTVEWNGIRLYKNHSLEISLDYEGRKDLCNVRLFKYDRYRKSPRENSDYKINSYDSGETIDLVVCDNKVGVISKVKHYTQTSKKNTVLFLLKDGKTINDVKKYIIEKFSCLDSHIILSSSLPDTPKVIRNRTKLSSISLWYFSYRPTCCWINPGLDNVDITKGTFYYVARHAYDYINKITDTKHNPSELKNLSSYLNGLEKTNINIYGVAKKDVKDLPSNWVEFTSFIAEKLKASIAESQKYIDDLNYYYSIKNIDNCYDYAYNAIRELKNKLPNDHKLVEWYNEYTKLKSIKAPTQPVGHDLVTKTFALPSNSQKLIFDCSIVDKYKLLKQYNRGYQQINSDILDYYYYILGVDQNG